MNALDLRHDPATAGYAALTDLDAGLHRAWPELSPSLVLPWSAWPVLACDPDGRVWVYGPAERDPLARDGRTVVPRAQRTALAALAERGAPFQRVAVAHELDPEGPVRPLLPALAGGPRRCTDAVARAVTGAPPAPPRTARTLRGLDGLLRGGRRALAAAADQLLDPIVFGVLGPRPPAEGEPCLWVPVVAWRW